jgi:hypothetical protein
MKVKFSTSKSSVRLEVKNFAVTMTCDQKRGKLSINFGNEEDSFNAFGAIKSLGIECYHTGCNAPCGPSVLIYPTNDFKFRTL